MCWADSHENGEDSSKKTVKDKNLYENAFMLELVFITHWELSLTLLFYFSELIQGEIGDPGGPGEPGPKGARGQRVSFFDAYNCGCFGKSSSMFSSSFELFPKTCKVCVSGQGKPGGGNTAHPSMPARRWMAVCFSWARSPLLAAKVPSWTLEMRLLVVAFKVIQCSKIGFAWPVESRLPGRFSTTPCPLARCLH